MVGVAVGVQRGDEREVQLAEQRVVARVLLEHRVDDHRLAGVRVAQKVGVGRRRGVEQLTEDEVGKHGGAPCAHGMKAPPLTWIVWPVT